MYSVIQQGRNKIGNSKAIFDDLSAKEVSRNNIQEQMDMQEEQTRNSTNATAAGAIAASVVANSTAAGLAMGPMGWAALAGLAAYNLF